MAFPFSSRTIGVMVRSIDRGYTNAEIGTLILEAEADAWDPTSAPNKQTRLQVLLQGMRQADDEAANTSGLEIARLVLESGARWDGWNTRPTDWYEAVFNAVAADGWSYDPATQRLTPTVPGVVISLETSQLEADLRSLGYETAAGHFSQALEAFGNGNWASSNSQLRSTMEDLILSLAESASGQRPTRVYDAIDVLSGTSFLIRGEEELIKSLWRMLHPNGSHPGLSDEPEARFRYLTVTGYATWLVARQHG